MRIAILTIGIAVTLAACAGGGDAPPAGGAVAVSLEEPTAGDREYAELTANWSPELLERCGGSVRDALGARDVVQATYAGVRDPDGRARDELVDAKHWLDEGNRRLTGVRPQLAAGRCDGAAEIALEEAVQSFVKAGTSAMQPASMVK